jgi:hypothetical protein
MSPLVFYSSKEEAIHFFALSSLFSFQKTLAMEELSAAELGPHASMATLAFFFLEDMGSIYIALPQSYGFFGQALSALERKNNASLMLPFTY